MFFLFCNIIISSPSTATSLVPINTYLEIGKVLQHILPNLTNYLKIIIPKAAVY